MLLTSYWLLTRSSETIIWSLEIYRINDVLSKWFFNHYSICFEIWNIDSMKCFETQMIILYEFDKQFWWWQKHTKDLALEKHILPDDPDAILFDKSTMEHIPWKSGLRFLSNWHAMMCCLKDYEWFEKHDGPFEKHWDG